MGDLFHRMWTFQVHNLFCAQIVSILNKYVISSWFFRLDQPQYASFLCIALYASLTTNMQVIVATATRALTPGERSTLPEWLTPITTLGEL